MSPAAGSPDTAESEPPVESIRARLVAALLPLSVLLAGTAAVFGSQIASLLQKTHHQVWDARLVNYALEHTWLWLHRDPLHRAFWQLPIFHPQPNVTAYTDVMLGLGPLYWVWRSLGAAPDTALQLWTLSCWLLNFAVGYGLLRRAIGVGNTAATLGAFLIAFGGRQLGQLYHPQLIPIFLVLMATWAAFEVFRAAPGTAGTLRERGWIGLFLVCAVLQAWAAFYPFFLFGCLLVSAGVWGVIFREPRNRLAALVGAHPVFLMVAFGVAGLAIAPLGLAYLQAAGEVAPRSFDTATIPRAASWFLTGPESWVHGWMQRGEGPFAHLADEVHGDGYGFATALVAVLGLVGAWSRPAIRILALATVSLVLLSTEWPLASPWMVLRTVVPGAVGIREVARITMILALAVPIGVALLADRRMRARRYGVVMLIAFLCFSEQLRGLPTLGGKEARRARVAALAQQVGDECEAFLLVPIAGKKGRKRHALHAADDAAWVGVATGKPSVNGRYGNLPPGFPFYQVPAPGKERARNRRLLRSWYARFGRSSDGVCLIEHRLR